MKYERMTSGVKLNDDVYYSRLMFEDHKVIDLINRLVELEDALESGALIKETRLKRFAEMVWDLATTDDEVGARYIILKLAEEEGVKLDRELKRYGEGGKKT